MGLNLCIMEGAMIRKFVKQERQTTLGFSLEGTLSTTGNFVSNGGIYLAAKDALIAEKSQVKRTV